MNEQVSMGPVVVLFHSAYGHTQRMAQAVEQGARELAETQLITIDANGEITPEDWQTLNKAAAIIMGTPAGVAALHPGDACVGQLDDVLQLHCLITPKRV